MVYYGKVRDLGHLAHVHPVGVEASTDPSTNTPSRPDNLGVPTPKARALSIPCVENKFLT